jgi:hypothetical protein
MICAGAAVASPYKDWRNCRTAANAQSAPVRQSAAVMFREFRK